MKLIKSTVKIVALSAAFVSAAATVSTTAQAQTGTRRRKATPTVSAAVGTPVDTPTVAAPVAPAPAPAPAMESGHHAYNLEAFVDPNARITSRNYVFDQGDLSRGFFLKDAALILSADLSSQTRAVIDLPFFTRPSATGNEFAFAQGYAQAYVTHTLSSVPLSFKFGQYSSFFGLEANSSRDRFFTEESSVKKFITPWTHMGAQVAWASEGATKFSVLGQIANSNVPTSGNSSVGALGDNNIELGLQGRVDAGMGYGALGFSMSKGQTYPVAIDSNDNNMLVELMGGLNFGAFNLGLQIDSKRTNGFSDSAFTAEVLGAYQATADLTLGARFETLSDVAMFVNGSTPLEMKSGWGLAAGPSYKLDTNLTVRGDVNYNTLKFDAINNGNSRSYFGVNFSAVASL